MLKQYQNIYFLGIGGVGMSGLAGWCHEKKYAIAGYDRDDNYFTLKLKSKGVSINHHLSIEVIPEKFLDKKNTLIVYTPAIKKDHKIYRFFSNQNFTIIKRAELLREIALDYNVIAISGTHGKTTISVMLSHILVNAGYSPNAFFGGISKNYDTNFLIGHSTYMIVEADEYDASFLKLNPAISVVTSIDRDHVDTYSSGNDMLEAYYQFYLDTFQGISDFKNKFFINSDCAKKFHSHISNRTHLGYKGKSCSDLIINEIECGDNAISKIPNISYIKNMCNHNIKNAIIASKIAKLIGISSIEIEQGFREYQGIKRRFEYHVDSESLILIDDYAHHPEELKFLIRSVRKLYPKRELFLIFQPHLFSRTQDLENEFCNVLQLVDKIGLLDIYPAREKPIKEINSKNLLKKINLTKKWYLNNDNINDILALESTNLIVTAGAGDIYKLIPKIKSIVV